MAVDPDAVKRLLALVMEKLNAEGPTDLVMKLGLTGEVPNAPRLAANWIGGVNAPRFDYTMTMLSAAGLLTPEADRAWKGTPADPTTEARAAAAAAAAALEKAAPGEQPRRGRRTG